MISLVTKSIGPTALELVRAGDCAPASCIRTSACACAAPDELDDLRGFPEGGGLVCETGCEQLVLASGVLHEPSPRAAKVSDVTVETLELQGEVQACEAHTSRH